MRTIVSQFIGFKDFDMVKKCIRQIILYQMLLMLAVSVTVSLLTDPLSRLFFIDEDTRRASMSSMLLVGLSVVPHSFVPLLSGALRWVCSRAGITAESWK